MIDLNSGKWDVVETEVDPEKVKEWFSLHEGEKYDWAGIFRFILPFLPSNRKQWFCSEAVAAAAGYDNPEEYYPGDLPELLREKKE